MSKLLAVDIGTTTFKAYVYDERGAALAHAVSPAPDETVEIAGVPVDIWSPDKVWDCVRSLFREVTRQLGHNRIEALAIDHMGLIGAPLDGQGRALKPFVTWIDPVHTRPLVDGFLMTSETLFAATGNRCSALYPPAWIGWLTRNLPGYSDDMRWWVNPGDYAAFRLTGELATDYSMASQTTCFDQRQLRYRPDMMEALGLPKDLFPPARAAGTPLGEVTSAAARETGLMAGMPVILGGADYICGPTGAGFVDPGDATIVTGTWELVVECLAAPALEPHLETLGAICDAHVAPNRWALRMENYSGDVTEWYREELGGVHQVTSASFWEAMIEDAEAAGPGSGGLLFVPHLFGSLGPRYDELARGAFIGLTKRATRREFARCVFEGLNFQTRHCYEALLRETGLSPRRVVCMGGATRNRFWMQNRANVLGRELEVVTVPDVAPRGCAILAGVGSGVFSSLADGVQAMAPSTTMLRPDPREVEIYDDLFINVYRPLVEQLAPFNARLSQFSRSLSFPEQMSRPAPEEVK